MKRAHTYKLYRETKTKAVNITTALVMVASSLGGALPILLSGKAFAATLDVCNTGCTYTSIQSAIDAAGSNDTISIGAGTYTETGINLNKSVSLAGAAGAEIDVPDAAVVNAINITANNATVSGLTIVGPASTSYKTYAWGGNVTRGITVANGVTNFTISGNTVKNLRNDILVDGRNTGSITGNVIDNSKSGISIQYTDGSDITITGNNEGTFGNDWGVNTHLNGHVLSDGVNVDGNNADKIAANAPAAAQQVVKDLSSSNNNWTVQDQGYSTSNRTAVQVSNAGLATAQGDPLGPIDTITNGIAAVVDGGKVNVQSGTYPMTTTNNVNKQVDIEGQSGATITTSGGNQIFTFTAPGSTLNGFTVTKTDKTSQNILGIQANDTTVSNNVFSGQYVAGDGEVARALDVSTSASSTISGNDISALRQPAYINDNATGQITNNQVGGTKGWVLVANSNFSFSGNTWGTNATDIAIIDNDANPATPITDNYTCSVMQAIKASNNNATIDNQVLTAPCPLAAPTNLTPTDGSYTNNPFYDNTWSSVNGAAKYVYQWSRSDAVDSNGALTGTIGYTDNGTYDQSTPGTVIRHNGFTSDGIYYWQVRAVDQDGSNGPWSVVNKLTVDAANPTVSISSPTANQVISGHSVTIKGTASDDNFNYYYCYVTGPSGEVGTRDAQCETAWAAGSPFHSAFAETTTGTTNGTLGTITLPNNLADGTYTVHVVAKDKAGNSTEATQNFVLDNTPPAVPAITFTEDSDNASVNSGGYTNSQHFTFHLPAGADHYQLKYWNNIPSSAFDGEANAWNPTDLSSYMTGNNYHDNFTQGEGTHYFAFSACDAAGNCSTYSDPFVVTYDKTAPTGLNNVSPASGTVTTTAGLTQVDWTDASDANGPVSYYYEVSNSPATNGDGSFVSTAYKSGALSDSQILTPGTPAGTYYWHVKAVDVAGNSTPWTTAWSFTIDNTAPVVAVNTQSTTDTTPTVTGTVDDGSAAVTVTVNGHTYTATVTGNTWSADVTDALLVGTYDVVATATDAAGNVGHDGTTNELTVTAPPSSPANNTTVAITNFSRQVAVTGPATTTGNTTGGDATTGDATNTNGAVLGTSTDNSNVKGDSTVNLQNAGDKKGNFAGLGWWWLAVLVAIAGLWLVLAKRRNQDEN